MTSGHLTLLSPSCRGRPAASRGEEHLMKGRQPTPLMRVTEFWMSVDKRGPDECWPWTGYTNKDGYGQFYFDGRMVGAHELAVTFTTGEKRLPELDTCHSCNNPPCCNPNHLRFDTRQSNVDDMIRAGRKPRPATRLTDEQVRLIRRRREAGAAQEDLAEQYRVSATFISLLVNGHRRREAGGPIATERTYKRKAG